MEVLVKVLARDLYFSTYRSSQVGPSDIAVVDLMASTAAPTADWESVSDTFYRKIQLYTALWDADFNLNDYFLRGAPYGGALGQHTDTQDAIRC